MKDLKELRDQIDVIDRQIVDLYQERMEIAAGVAEYKINTGKKVFDKEREDSKLATLTALGKTDFNKHGIRELFEQIMSMSRKRQYQLLTAHGMYEKPDFTVVDSFFFLSQSAYCVSGDRGCVQPACIERVLWRADGQLSCGNLA